MSHLSKVSNIKLTDLALLEKACRSLGVDLDRSKKTYKSYYTEEIETAACIVDKEGGEAAVVKTENAGYEIQWDSYGNSLKAVIGGNCEKLTHAYSVEAVLAQANSIGMVSSVNTREDGSTVVVGCFL